MNDFVKTDLINEKKLAVITGGIIQKKKKNIPKKQENTFYTASAQEEISVGHEFGSGGGGGMNDVLRRLDDLERNQREFKHTLDNQPSKADLKNLSLELQIALKKEFENIPNEDRIKTIITEQLSTNKIATETFVDSKISKAKLAIILWSVGIGVTVLGTILTALLRKMIP